MPLPHCILLLTGCSLTPDIPLPSCCCFPQMPVGYRPIQHSGIRFPVPVALPVVLPSPKSAINGWLPYLPGTLLSVRQHQGHDPGCGSYAVQQLFFPVPALHMAEILPHIQTVHFLPEYSCVRFPDTGIYLLSVRCRLHKTPHKNISENLRYDRWINAILYWNGSELPVLFLPALPVTLQPLQNDTPDTRKHLRPRNLQAVLQSFYQCHFLAAPLRFVRILLQYLRLSESHPVLYFLKQFRLFLLHPTYLSLLVQTTPLYPDNQTSTSDARTALLL